MKKTIKTRLNEIKEKLDETEFRQEFDFLFEENHELRTLFSAHTISLLTEAKQTELLNEVISIRSFITNFFKNAKKILAELETLDNKNMFNYTFLMRTPTGYKYYILYFFGSNGEVFSSLYDSVPSYAKFQKEFEDMQRELSKFAISLRQKIAGIIKKQSNKERDIEQAKINVFKRDASVRTYTLFSKAAPIDFNVSPLYRGVVQHVAPLTGDSAEGEGKLKAGLKYVVGKNKGPILDKEKKEFKINISLFGIKNLFHLNRLFAAKGAGFMSGIGEMDSFVYFNNEQPFAGTTTLSSTDATKKNKVAYAIKYKTLKYAAASSNSQLDLESVLPKCILVNAPPSDFYNTFNVMAYSYLMTYVKLNGKISFAGGHGGTAYRNKELLDDMAFKVLFQSRAVNFLKGDANISYAPSAAKELTVFYTPFVARGVRLDRRILLNLDKDKANKNAKTAASLYPCIVIELADGSNIMGSIFKKLMRGVLAVGNATRATNMPVYGATR